MFRGLVARVGSLLFIGHDSFPFPGHAHTHKKDISFLKRDVAFPSYLQDIGQFHLVGGKSGVGDPFFRCPCRIVDQHPAAGNAFSRPVLQTNPIIAPVSYFCCSRTSVKKPFRLSRDGLGEMPQAIPLATLF